MRKVIFDENNVQVDELAERNSEIISRLEGKMEELKTEQRLDKKGNKRFGFRAMMQIENELMQFPLMRADRFAELDCDDIEYVWRNFHALMSHYNMIFEIVPTRQSFQLYMGVNSRMYKKLVNGGEYNDEDIKNLMMFIEDRLVGHAFTASESGNTDSKAVSTRLRAKDVGHDVITASEDKFIEKTEVLSPFELTQRFENVARTLNALKEK